MKRLRVRLITTRMVWGITEVRRALERNIAVLTLRAISGNYVRPFTHSSARPQPRGLTSMRNVPPKPLFEIFD